MSSQLNLTATNTSANNSPDTKLTMQMIMDSPLDDTSKSVYLIQYQDLQTEFYSEAPQSVERFVANKELDRLASDYRLAMDMTMGQRQWQRYQETPQPPSPKEVAHPQDSQSAELWKQFRGLNLDR